MVISPMKPDDIYNAFIKRICYTNMLYNSLSEDSTVELLNTVFFKYYFDISTAIESVIRGITFVESYKSRYIEFLSHPTDDSIPFFKKYDEIKALCDINKMYSYLNEENFKNLYQNKISILRDKNLTLSFKNTGDFCVAYKKARKTRNILAHGLISNDVDYSTDTLFSFLYVFYILHTYYKFIDTDCE